ncbi:MAG: diguanylate cyclase (GGDEF)-like protein [Flavobacteriales bacterium]|jgi:diguanylate cyclase (GGDEF)-like protein
MNFLTQFSKAILLVTVLLSGSNSIATESNDIAIHDKALPPTIIDGSENGISMSGRYEIWHDMDSSNSITQVLTQLEDGAFILQKNSKSTGLKTGSTWSHFKIHNSSNRSLTVHLEYVDHQLITLNAYQKSDSQKYTYSHISTLSLSQKFSHRIIPHNRFIFPATIKSGATSDFIVEFRSDKTGFVFPNLRIWSPKQLRRMQLTEIGIISFFFGGFFLMSIFSLVGGIASREKAFVIYSFYALSKIWAWATILGYTHQFLITENFHWSYMSLSGSVTIFFGLLFSRVFLETRTHLRRLDYVLLFMMANAVFLFFSALFKLTSFAVISITLALLLYPTLSIAGIIRWYQGSREGIIFSFAWTFLVVGLFVNALRDLGFVEHNIYNYYWPPLASFTEMTVILVAMGMYFRRLRKEKVNAVQAHTRQLEQSKEELEVIVKERTQNLEAEKSKAEKEAQTDSLTGIFNRRHFYRYGITMLDKAAKRDREYSVLMFDIDKFKNINDAYGHAIGDEALRAFSRAIQKHVRIDDLFSRLGGEEFALLLCESPTHSLQAAERLRKAVSDIVVDSEKGQLQFTTSIGVSHFNHNETLETLLNRADKALFVAKSEGRNRVIEAE